MYATTHAHLKGAAHVQQNVCCVTLAKLLIRKKKTRHSSS